MDNFSAKNNAVNYLEWNEHIQKRPLMYIEQLGDGSDPKDGIYTLLKGILALALDERPVEVGKGIAVEVKEDCASIRDFGRGIPFNQIVPATSEIFVGMGAKDITIHPVKVANALSIDFYVVSYRDGECSWVKYSKGNLLEKGIEKTTENNGTFIKFMPNPEVFSGYSFRLEIVKDLLTEIARENNGLSITLNGVTIIDY